MRIDDILKEVVAPSFGNKILSSCWKRHLFLLHQGAVVPIHIPCSVGSTTTIAFHAIKHAAPVPFDSDSFHFDVVVYTIEVVPLLTPAVRPFVYHYRDVSGVGHFILLLGAIKRINLVVSQFYGAWA